MRWETQHTPWKPEFSFQPWPASYRVAFLISSRDICGDLSGVTISDWCNWSIMSLINLTKKRYWTINKIKYATLLHNIFFIIL